MTTPYKKKLIEVAIPLEAINAASAREKSIRHGHPSTLHLWWARRPLAACRAVLFAQLVDDPSAHPDQFPTHEDQERERKRLFAIIEDLVKWENSTNEEVLERARAEIRRSCGGELPPVYDPFSGGGSIPLEAQRLGLPAYGSDLNPVAVMIGKAMIEIPPKFRDMPPVHPGIKERSFYRNAEGLAEDVKYYGEWMRVKALERIGHLYPQVDLPKAYGGRKATVIAWIWARTVPSPDPAFSDVQVPLVSSFFLSSKKGRETWIQPEVDKAKKKVVYSVRVGGAKSQIEKAKEGTKSGRGASFRCFFSNAAITPEYIRSCASSGRMGETLICIVAQGSGGRAYLSPSPEDERVARSASPKWKPDSVFFESALGFRIGNYGMSKWSDLFTPRQLVALSTLSDLVGEAASQVLSDYQGGDQQAVRDYAIAVATYLAFAVSKTANRASTICTFKTTVECPGDTFGRHALPMTWDFAESNCIGGPSGSFESMLKNTVAGLLSNSGFSQSQGFVQQADAKTQVTSAGKVISTDPPYYDNIGYADLSDFFYIWLKPALGGMYPDVFGTLATPKTDELVATPARHGGSSQAEAFFVNGMREAVEQLEKTADPAFPATIYYAFKQSEIEAEGLTSKGWATFLEAIVAAGYAIVGTWPVRTERTNRIRAMGSNALANSVVLVCRKKDATADTITRAEFIRALKRELPPAIAELQAANIAPADMPQSAIGPGMGVFSRYKVVLEADDSPMSVKTALQLINAELDEYLGGIQGEFDADTRFAITWYEQNGMSKGEYGTADNLARARGISVDSVKHAGIVESAAGKVRLLAREEIDPDWAPEADSHLTIWECLQHLVRLHEAEGVSFETARMLRRIGEKAEAVKDLAYCLYDISANKRKDAREATAYNALIADWADLTREAAAITDISGDRQTRLDL